MEPEAVEPEAVEPEAAEPEAVEPEAVEPEAAEPEAVEPEAGPAPAEEPAQEDAYADIKRIQVDGYTIGVLPGYTSISQDENGNYQFYYGNSFLRIRYVDVSQIAGDSSVQMLYGQIVGSIMEQTGGELIDQQYITINDIPVCVVNMNMYTVPSRLLLYYSDNMPGMLEASYLDLDGDAQQAEDAVDVMIHTLAATEG